RRPSHLERMPDLTARLPSSTLIMLGGLPTDPPVDAAGLFKKLQVRPLSSVAQASMKWLGPSLRRMAVRIRVGESRTEEDMMANPSGSGPIQETSFQVFPPAVVRAQKTRPSRPLSLGAVMKASRSCLPLTM